MQNLILNRLGTNLKSKKSKPKKLVFPFLFALFHFRTDLIKFGFLIFSGWLQTAEKFTPGRPKAEKLAGSGKKKIIWFASEERCLVPKQKTLFHYVYIDVYLFIEVYLQLSLLQKMQFFRNNLIKRIFWFHRKVKFCSWDITFFVFSSTILSSSKVKTSC